MSMTEPVSAIGLASAGAPPAPEQVHQIALEQLRPSSRNPRQHFDEAALKELTASVATLGIRTPLQVRAVEDHFEIIAGERRYRAAQIAGLATVPAIVVNVGEDEAFELAVVENVQRQQLTPLEEARSFRTLLDHAGTGGRAAAAQKIARRICKSATYVWDLAKLVDLIPDAQRLLERGLITWRHAVPLARLTPAQQLKAIEVPDSPHASNRSWLFVDDAGFTFQNQLDDEKAGQSDPYAGVKARSVREFEAAIAKYCRFDIAHAAQAAPLEFGPVAEQVQVAASQPGRGKKVIQITFDSFVQPDAKQDLGSERIFTRVSWKLADGSDKKSPVCEKSVLGIVAVGPGYGQPHQVCVNKDCPVHWAAERREREKRANARERQEADGGAAERARQQREEEAARKRQAQEEASRAKWQKSMPAIRQATIDAIRTAKASRLADLILDALQPGWGPQVRRKAQELLGKPKDADSIVRHAALMVLLRSLDAGDARERFTKLATAVGVNVAAIVNGQAEPGARTAGRPARAPRGKARR